MAQDPQPSSFTASTKGEQTRRAILAAAIERFGRDGFRSTSVADIARDAAVSGTLAYNYFDNKESLFLAALDEDAAGVIAEGMVAMPSARSVKMAVNEAWRDKLIFLLLDALDDHPLARRVLGGLEPQVTGRIIELPALTELRLAVGEQLRIDQEAGLVRPDIDPMAIGAGAVTMYLSILMSIVQFGTEGLATYGPDVMALLAAAIEPVDHEAGT